MAYQSTKVLELGSCAFRQWKSAPCACSRIHGYDLTVKLWFGADELDHRNWIQHFGGLKELQQQIRHYTDHTTAVAADDPCLEQFRELDRLGAIDLRVFEKGVGIERFAEFIWEMTEKYVREQSNGRVWCEKVELFEHNKNSALFIPDRPNQYRLNSKPQPANESEFFPETSLGTQSSSSTYSTAASVGSTSSSGLGNLFAGTRLG